jgi:hypothetical protein
LPRFFLPFAGDYKRKSLFRAAILLFFAALALLNHLMADSPKKRLLIIGAHQSAQPQVSHTFNCALFILLSFPTDAFRAAKW